MIIFCLLPNQNWYKSEVKFSNWRNQGEFDYSVNATVSNYYCYLSGQKYKAKYFRQENIKEFNKRLLTGDTLKVGLDYYALTGISFPFVKAYFGGISNKDFNTLSNGGIIRLKVWAKDSLVVNQRY